MIKQSARTRDMRTFVQAYLKATGLTQEAFALLIDRDQGTDSKIVSGRRKRFTIDDLETSRDGLHAPGHLFSLTFGPHETDAPTRPERGNLIAAGRGGSPDRPGRLVAVTTRPAPVDRGVVKALVRMLASQRRLEDSIGARPVLETVRPQLTVLSNLVAAARGSMRPELVDVAAQWFQFAGWLGIAVGEAPGHRDY